MSAEPYIPEPYITTADAYDAVGITEAKQKTLTAEVKKRYQQWVRETNDKIENELFPDADAIPLVEGSKEYTYAKDAGINWIKYKQRSRTGSANAKEAKADYRENIDLAKQYLKRVPTEKNMPIIVAETTNSLEDHQFGYSQTQGYPPDTLY